MPSYNEQLSINNARIQFILERVENLPSGPVYDTCTVTLNFNYLRYPSKRAWTSVSEDGKVTANSWTRSSTEGATVTLSNVLCGSYLYIDYYKSYNEVITFSEIEGCHLECPDDVSTASYTFKITEEKGANVTISCT